MCLSMYFYFKYVRSLCRSLWTWFECWGWFWYGEGIKESPFLKRDRAFGVGLYVDRLTTSLLVGGLYGGLLGVDLLVLFYNVVWVTFDLLL